MPEREHGRTEDSNSHFLQECVRRELANVVGRERAVTGDQLPVLVALTSDVVVQNFNAKFSQLFRDEPWHLAGHVADLSEVVYRRTDGNALFMVNFVDSLLQRGLLVQVEGRWVLPRGLAAVETNVPETLQGLLQEQIEGLGPEEQRVLEVASVEGVHFTSAAVAVGVIGEQQVVEAVCVTP